MRTLIQRLIALVLLVIVAAMFYYLFVVVRGNAKEAAQCERWVLKVVNYDLVDVMGMEPLDTIAMPSVSRFSGVPDVVKFSASVSNTKGAANRDYAGTLEGEFDRTKHIVTLKVVLKTGGGRDFAHNLMKVKEYVTEMETGEVAEEEE